MHWSSPGPTTSETEQNSDLHAIVDQKVLKRGPQPRCHEENKQRKAHAHQHHARHGRHGVSVEVAKMSAVCRALEAQPRLSSGGRA